MSEQLGNITVTDEQLISDGGSDGGNSGNGAGNFVDPGNVEPPRRGRGRPRRADSGDDKPAKPTRSGAAPAAKPARKASQTVVSTDALAFTVGVIGNFIAARAKMELLALDEDEQKTIAEAAGNVLKHYEIPVSEKTAAWAGLATALGTIYGGKIAAIKMARALNK